MPAGESATHLQLKTASLRWAGEQGYRAGAMEVRVPNSNFRADAAAYRAEKFRRDADPPEIGLTAIFECKAQRPDYLKDSKAEEKTIARLEECRARMSKLERQLGVHHPTLRLGETLFPEFDRHDFSDLPHQGYQKLRKEVATLERSRFGKTKFDRMVRYRCANLFYAVVAQGVMTEDEIPSAWGLLQLDAETEALHLIRQPIPQDIPAGHRLQLLQNIAAKNSELPRREK